MYTSYSERNSKSNLSFNSKWIICGNLPNLPLSEICRLSWDGLMLCFPAFYERSHTSQICGLGNPLRLRQRDQDPLHQARDYCRYLQFVPSLLHWHAKIRRYRRTSGQIPATHGQDPGRASRRRDQEEEKVAAFPIFPPAWSNDRTGGLYLPGGFQI